MDLKQYVMDVEHLEKQKYALERIIGSIDKKLKTLGRPYTVQRRNNPISEEDTSVNSTRGGLIVAAILLITIGLYLFCEDPSAVSLGVALILITPAVLILIGVYAYMKSNIQKYDQNEIIIQREYQAQLQAAKQQEQFEKKIAVYYQQARNKLYTTYQKTCNLLGQIYAKGIIAEEYRYDIVAICTFSQYLRSRKCFTLEGHEGAYLLYEEEKYRRIVLGKLDEIIQHLDRIEQNQYGIVMALREINSTQNRILNNLQGIAQRQEQQLDNAEYMRYDLEVLKTNSNIAMIYGMNYQ